LNQLDIERFLRLAMEEAEAAAMAGDHPYGAVIVDQQGTIVATGRNGVNTDCDPTSHAETNAIRAACRSLGTLSLAGYQLFTNGAPCTMCATTIIRVGISDIWYSAPPDAGRTMPTIEDLASRAGGNAPTVVQGILKDDARDQLDKWSS
jgi:tRNA(Arg) A34 adenosine deaminase TadA